MALLACAGCDLITDSFVTNDFSGDPFPIAVDQSTGAVIVGLREADGTGRTAVIDLLSPITLVDPGPGVTPTIDEADLLVLGVGAGGQLDLPRAQLSGAQVLSLHPCANAELACSIGTEAAPRAFDAIIGADALAGDAVRLRLGSDQIFILADVAGDEQQRLEVCDAVFPSPYRGGGTLVINNTELPFAGRRVTMQTCLSADPDAPVQADRGVDTLMLISTSIGITMIGETTYARYLQIRPAALPLDQLPVESVFLPSGLVTGRRATIENLAMVARSSSTPRAPCRHVYGHRLLAERDCMPGEDCPCEGGDTFCAIPAVVEVNAPVDVLVLPDDNDTLQALRTELRPDQPEVDGIIGTNALEQLELDIDYPHARVLGRCTGPDCVARPALPEREFRPTVDRCLP